MATTWEILNAVSAAHPLVTNVKVDDEAGSVDIHIWVQSAKSEVKHAIAAALARTLPAGLAYCVTLHEVGVAKDVCLDINIGGSYSPGTERDQLHKALRFLAGLQLQDQPLAVQRERDAIVREAAKSRPCGWADAKAESAREDARQIESLRLR